MSVIYIVLDLECDCSVEAELQTGGCYYATNFEFEMYQTECLSRYYGPTSEPSMDPTTNPITAEPTTAIPTAAPSAAQASNADGLSTTATALIIVFSVLFVIMVIILICYWMKKRSLNQQTSY